MSSQHKVITEYIRRGTRLAPEEVTVPPLSELLHTINIETPSHPHTHAPLPPPLWPEALRRTLLLRALVSDTTAVAALPDDGRPDGLTVDADGGVWVAAYGAGLVYGFSPDGVLVERVEVGAANTTACTFGGDALDRLFITTSKEDADPDEDPRAGSLFVAEVGVRGRPVRPFAG